ncbi:MAG TPA: NTF2 fold immunity protein [Bacteroidia bacterium]|nr:NTF2 fold immunity protein [Bacteroidia bacterium]
MRTLLALALCFISSLVFSQADFKPHYKGSNDSVINSYENLGLHDTLLKNKETAVAVAEAILFNTFGKQAIESEKPYEIHLENGCWHISGTLPKGYLGGVFSIVLNAQDGKAVVFPHGK